MARGRAPNLSLPPTRALTQQRDYRARKAARIAYLERTNKELGEEVENLRRELIEVKEGKERHGDVEKLRALRESLVQTLTAIDRILPPLTSNEADVGGSDTKLSIAVNIHAASAASGSMCDQDQSDRREKRKMDRGEGTSGFGSLGDETSPQTGRSTAQLVDEFGRLSPKAATGELSSQGCAGRCPPKSLTTGDVNPSNRAKRSRKVSGTASSSAASGSQPTGMAIAPAPTIYAPQLFQHLPPPPPATPLLPSFGPLPGQEQILGPYHPHWSPRVVQPTCYMKPPAYQSSEGAFSHVSTTPFPHSADRQVQSWHNPSPVGYHAQLLPESDRGGFQQSPAGSSQSSHLPHPSPHPEYRHGVLPQPPHRNPPYDPSSCNELFDCSSIPQPLRPVVHDVTATSGPAAAAAVLTSERSVPGTGNAEPAWSDEQRSMQMQQRPPDQGQSREQLTATTTVQWQELNSRVSGTWSSTTWHGAPGLEVPSASSGGVKP